MKRRQLPVLFQGLRYTGYVLYLLFLAAVLLLLWHVRSQPLELPILWGRIRVDSLGAFFALLTLLVALVTLLLRELHPLLLFGMTLLLLPAFATSSLLLLAVSYLLATSLLIAARYADWRTHNRTSSTAHPKRSRSGSRRLRFSGHFWRTAPHALSSRLRTLPAALQSGVTRPRTLFLAEVTWLLLPCLCLGLGYAALQTQSGTWRYNLPLAGAGLTSFVFWFVLLAALTGVGARVVVIDPTNTRRRGPDLLLALAWCYPLVRLYSLGPWNPGWHFATLLLGGALTLWAAWRALTGTVYAVRVRRLLAAQAGLALASIGLGTSAGLAAGCYALLTVPLLLFGLAAEPDAAGTAGARPAGGWSLWLLSAGLPFTAPFVAAWMGIGAAAGAHMFLLAGIFWLATLLATLTLAQFAGRPPPVRGRRRIVAAGVSLVLGGAAPGVISLLIRPIVQQLQGGMTPFGDLELWPWGGLLALDSARRTVAALPSATIVALMLVLGALAWLLIRLNAALRTNRPTADDAHG